MNTPIHLPSCVEPLARALVASPSPVFITDRQNRVVFWNESAQGLLGYAAGEVAGVSCAGLLQGCDVHGNRYCSETCPITQMAARGEAIHHFDLRLQSKDRRTVVVDVSILHLALDEPDRYLLVHILNPATRRKVEAPEPVPPRSTLEAARESPDARARRLTPREVEVLGMLAAGHAAPAIASRLHISTLTARNHIQNVLEKLEVHSKAEAVAFAFQKRLL